VFPQQPTSLSLLQRVRNRDPQAWERFVGLYEPLVRYWCGRWQVVGEDAADVCQEVFQAVATGIDQFRRDRAGDTMRGWMRGITRHKLLDHFRLRAQEPRAAGGTDAQLRLQGLAEPEVPLDEPQEQATSLYHRALELVRCEFEERTWQAFWRAAVEGQSPVDTATDLGVTPAAVRKAKSRILLRLREELGELGELAE
jgi:RNA polymerase sigma-70 factor (ECF subfamily)